MRGVVAALGTFDGVHLGHQAVVRRAVEVGRESGERVVAATFDPHPRAVLRPGSEPPLLSTLELRREALLGCGVDEVHTIRFDPELSRKSPEEFVRDVVVGELGARAVVVGENFRFGYRAAGGVEELAALLAEHGGELYPVPLYEQVSSSRIRQLISEGEVVEAGGLLGRAYVLRGEVVVGDRRGRTIGFPTANVVADPRALVPGRGVYAGFVELVGGARYGACTNVGVAPTFDRHENRVEAHLLDYEGDLYGRTIDVGFVEMLRGERRFSGLEELRAQISRDVAEARRRTGGVTSQDT